MARTVIATVRTYDSNSLVDTGYDVTIYSDGRIRAEYRTRWQGCRCGVVYAGQCPADILAAACGDDDALSPDLETLVREWCAGDGPDSLRRIRSGYVVQ